MLSYSKLIKLVLPVFIFGCSSNSGKAIILEEMIKSLELQIATLIKAVKQFMSIEID
jgi:hypothetical protein